MYKLKLHTVHVLGEFITSWYIRSRDSFHLLCCHSQPVSHFHFALVQLLPDLYILYTRYTFEYIESQTSSCIVYKIKLAICCSFEIVHSEKAHSFIDV